MYSILQYLVKFLPVDQHKVDSVEMKSIIHASEKKKKKKSSFKNTHEHLKQ